jgi:predicted nucleic acid-binding protein
MKWVVDASVAAKWLAPEEDSAQALKYLNAELLAPDLLFAEVANILWK